MDPLIKLRLEDGQPNLYIWDSLEGRGNALTDHIIVIELEELSHEERLVISGGDPMEIQKIATARGCTLNSQLIGNAQVFIALINEVFANSGSEEKARMLQFVRKFLNNGGID